MLCVLGIYSGIVYFIYWKSILDNNGDIIKEVMGKIDKYKDGVK